MTDQHVRPVTWLTSGYDFKMHAFYSVGEGKDVSQALCTHSLPSERLADLGGDKCVACLLIHGGDLAEQHGDQQNWSTRHAPE